MEDKAKPQSKVIFYLWVTFFWQRRASQVFFYSFMNGFTKKISFAKLQKSSYVT